MRSAESIDQQSFDVIIIGAGVAGAMSAILCSRAGLKTLLLDRQRFPRDKVCGCCLNSRAIQLLRMAGLGEGLNGLNPSIISSLAIRHAGRHLNLSMPAGVAVSRRSLDEWLVNEAQTAGCRFVDHVAATVGPVNESDPCGSPSATDCVSKARIRSITNDCATNTASEFRVVELQSVSSQQRNVTADLQRSQQPVMAARVFGRIVLVCDGLGHPSLHKLAEFHAPPVAGSRIGLGAVFDRTTGDDWIRPNEILMAVGDCGYAGIVEIENHQLNLAAAVNPYELNQTKSPLLTLQRVFESAGLSMPNQLLSASIRGTLPLTRSAKRIAAHRLLLLGDATGYVEPFTGEGMAWALSAACAVVPLVIRAVRHGRTSDLTSEWPMRFREAVGRQQYACRILSASLRRPWLLSPMMTAGRLFPAVTRRIVGQINRIPEALEST